MVKFTTNISAKILILIFILSLTVNCKKEKLDDKLTMQRKEYIGNQLRIDGYYYYKYGNPEYISMQFMYKNGIIMDMGVSNKNIDAIETEILTPEYINAIKKYKCNWGVFQIENTSIKFEKWYPVSDGVYHAYVRSGAILNDTTFVINESYRFQDGQKTEIRSLNEIYRFKNFSPKPDSTNSFIE